MTIRDRNHQLLMGCLAHRLGFLDRRALERELVAWTADPSESLCQRLVRTGRIDETITPLLDRLLTHLLERHNHDLGECFAALELPSGLQRDLERLVSNPTPTPTAYPPSSPATLELTLEPSRDSDDSYANLVLEEDCVEDSILERLLVDEPTAAFRVVAASLEQALTKRPEDARVRLNLARGMATAAWILNLLDRPEEALTELRQALGHYRYLANRHPQSPLPYEGMFWCHRLMERIARRLERPEDARLARRSALQCQAQALDRFLARHRQTRDREAERIGPSSQSPPSSSPDVPPGGHPTEPGSSWETLLTLNEQGATVVAPPCVETQGELARLQAELELVDDHQTLSHLVSDQPTTSHVLFDQSGLDPETRDAPKSLTSKSNPLDTTASPKSESLTGESTLRPAIKPTIVIRSRPRLAAASGESSNVSSEVSDASSPGQEDASHNWPHGWRYQVLGIISSGGAGRILKAEDRDLGRQVAIKEMQPHLAGDSLARARFQMEAEITAGLDHAGVVPVFDRGHTRDGRPFYVMRLLAGETFRAVVDRLHQTEFNSHDRRFRRLLNHLVSACQTVHYAHTRGVMHRDLKPENLMVCAPNELIVIDWGLAKLLGPLQPMAHADRDPAGSRLEVSPNLLVPADASQVESDSWSRTLDPRPIRPASIASIGNTVFDRAVGTPQYMSPEQAQGRIDLLGPASDVFSLGATLWYLLTGGPLYDFQDLDLMLDQAARGGPPSRHPDPRRIDPALTAIALQALDPAIDARPRSAKALAEALEDWLWSTGRAPAHGAAALSSGGHRPFKPRTAGRRSG